LERGFFFFESIPSDGVDDMVVVVNDEPEGNPNRKVAASKPPPYVKIVRGGGFGKVVDRMDNSKGGW
jgi:hypothetical protein